MKIGYSKIMNKQRVDFYIEEIQRLCNEYIDNIDDEDGKELELLDLIIQSASQIKQTQEERYQNRKRELASMTKKSTPAAEA